MCRKQLLCSCGVAIHEIKNNVNAIHNATNMLNMIPFVAMLRAMEERKISPAS
jgi:hypothetical protein